jgi:hypothetical protein
MPPAVVFMEADWEIPKQPSAEDWEMTQQPLAGDGGGGGEDWDSELLVPAQGRLLYVGQGESRYTFFHQSTPGLLWPKKKRRKRKKKTASLQPPPPEPAPLPPAPINRGDWEELCQSAPPTPALWQPEDWEPDICPPSPREDWDAEIAASQAKEDWDAEIVASQ